MNWFPLVKPHKIEQPRWSGRHDLDLLGKLSAPLVDDRVDKCAPCTGTLLVASGADLVYVSSPTTLTVLHSALGHVTKEEAGHVTHQTELAKQVVLSPSVSDIQLFELKLSIYGLHCCGGVVYVHTLYSVLVLSKEKGEGKYSLLPLVNTEEMILDICEVESVLLVLTESRLFSTNQDVKQVDMNLEDVWRTEEPLSRARLNHVIRSGEYVIMEPTAVHHISKQRHTVLLTIPNDDLSFEERFINCHVTAEGNLLLLTQDYLLIYAFFENCAVSLQRKLAHNVSKAHFGQFYPEDGSDFPHFSVFSSGKVSFYQPSDIPRSEYMTFIVPYKTAKLSDIQISVLTKRNYLNRTVDKRHCVTQRINSGISGAYCYHHRQHFILSEHKDLFQEGLDNDSPWEAWLDSMTYDREYHVDYINVDLLYSRLLETGSAAVRKQETRKKEEEEEDYVPMDPLFCGPLTDKHAQTLVEKWKWD